MNGKTVYLTFFLVSIIWRHLRHFAPLHAPLQAPLPVPPVVCEIYPPEIDQLVKVGFTNIQSQKN